MESFIFALPNSLSNDALRSEITVEMFNSSKELVLIGGEVRGSGLEFEEEAETVKKAGS